MNSKIIGWRCFYCDTHQFFGKSPECPNMGTAKQLFIKQMNVPRSHHNWIEVEAQTEESTDSIQRSGTG